jgi:HK97 gp10 family phage protein
MADSTSVQVTVNYDAVERLTRSGEAHDMLAAASMPVVFDARGRAPKDTGRGARSVHSEMVLTADEWESVISWDQLHYYMRFSELGTQQRPPHPFLVPALKAAQK